MYTVDLLIITIVWTKLTLMLLLYPRLPADFVDSYIVVCIKLDLLLVLHDTLVSLPKYVVCLVLDKLAVTSSVKNKLYLHIVTAQFVLCFLHIPLLK